MSQYGCAVLHFMRSEDGPTTVEYGLMTALIVVVCMNVLTTLGHLTSGTFSKVNSSLS